MNLANHQFDMDTSKEIRRQNIAKRSRNSNVVTPKSGLRYARRWTRQSNFQLHSSSYRYGWPEKPYKAQEQVFFSVTNHSMSLFSKSIAGWHVQTTLLPCDVLGTNNIRNYGVTSQKTKKKKKKLIVMLRNNNQFWE